MDGHSSSGPVTVLLLAALTSSALGQSQSYFSVGDSLVLTPPKHGTTITSVLWTHNSNLVVEWVNKDLEFFGSFEGRGSLNERTAQLTVSAAKQSDGGEYRVEINNQLQSQVYTVIVIKKVPKPSVEVRTLTCSPKSSNCTLTCQGDPTGTEPVTYSWRKDSGGWGPEQQSMDLIIINDEKTRGVKQFSCRMKNPVSEEESDPLKNPMYQEDPLSAGGLAAIICFLIVAVVLAGLCVWKREAIKKKFCAGSETVSSEVVRSSDLAERDGSPSVNRPLNQKPN
ncbi:SLAM family member 5-like [Hippoglossus hippoglossus]|uniref:SLAM family member 5-like n=1 Tax=Hippoglossus hippoglossus TaxID=8267 RepID=UPI00148DF80F|nr:SLAM family member 5-like [Hippoglossus hippoglossus]